MGNAYNEITQHKKAKFMKQKTCIYCQKTYMAFHDESLFCSLICVTQYKAQRRKRMQDPRYYKPSNSNLYDTTLEKLETQELSIHDFVRSGR